VADPRPVHWEAVKRMLRYLQGKRHVSLVYASSNSTLAAHADADWAGGAERASVSGNVIMIEKSLVGWRSTKQRRITLSSTREKYTSLLEAGREVTWVRNLMNELGHEQTNANPISQDNTGSVSRCDIPRCAARRVRLPVTRVCERVCQEG
jgi:hypothetical protein